MGFEGKVFSCALIIPVVITCVCVLRVMDFEFAVCA